MDEFDYSIHYSRFHDDTEEHAIGMSNVMSNLIKPHLPSRTDIRILDVGCGFGFSLRALRSLGFRNVSGVERSTQQAERCCSAGFHVEVTSDTSDWLAEHSAEFDFVLLLDVLEHIPVSKHIDFLRAIYRSLKPHGKVLITTPNANAILSGRWRYIDFTHYCSFTEHSLYFVLKNAGFDYISLDTSKGLGRFPRRLWRQSARAAARKWIIRWCWLQVYKAEIPIEHLDGISFELNLLATAERR